MRFTYLNDMHGRGKNSVHRRGNYLSDWLNKIDETIDIHKEKDCDFMIIGGDIFDSHTVSNAIVDDFVDRIEKNNIKVYVVWGNHDLISCNKENSKSSSLAHILRRSKNFEELGILKKDNAVIKGFDYFFGIEDHIKENGLVVPEGDFKIAIPHAFITIKPFHPDVSHVLTKDIETNANLILCSHFHENWGIKDMNNAKYVNLGAFGRLSVSEANHVPKVAVVDTEAQRIDIIELSTAKSGEEVFDLQKYNELKENKKDIKDFLEKLDSVEWQSMDLRTQISKIGKEEKIEQNVIDYIFETIGEE